ncbi:MAG: hypothetical protein WC615_21945 [Mucilaginibacter sp.]|jgi:hypothetical protein|uniref:hypothetical protein n=1 Tax=Mucilaginibacter sp. TaxID=1882438 RepID=UPI00356855A3
MPTDQLSPYQLLLETFGLGVKTGVITPARVIVWADEMIMAHDEPNYFFIELSLSGNKNEIIEVINRHVVTSDNPICTRVLLGCVYRSFTDDNNTLTIEDTATMVGRLPNYDALTGYEVNQIYEFYDYNLYYLPDLTQLQSDLHNFLLIYEPFTLDNYNRWEEVNAGVIQELKNYEIQQEIINQSFIKQYQKKERKKKLKRYLKLIIIAIPVLAILYCLAAISDLFKNAPIIYPVILGYYLIRGGMHWWDSKKKSRA